MIEQASYFLLCVAALGFAAHFPVHEKSSALAVAAALLGNWLLCQWTFSAHPPQMYLGLRASDIWGLADALLGIFAIGLAWWRLWGWAVWAISIIQCGFHLLFQWGGIEYATYAWWLDKLLLATIAVFVVRGGPGVADRCLGYLDRLWAGLPSDDARAQAYREANSVAKRMKP